MSLKKSHAKKDKGSALFSKHDGPKITKEELKVLEKYAPKVMLGLLNKSEDEINGFLA